MCRLLILDDDLLFCQTLQDTLIRQSVQPRHLKVDISTSVPEANQKIAEGIQNKKTYDILLIDQRLDDGQDGIDVLKELLQISPDSEAIIFTGLEDAEGGRRAYEAGAFRYLPKPFDTKELLFLIDSIEKWRAMQVENVWRRSFIEIAEKAECSLEFGEAARVITEGALNLGFERSRLFWKPDEIDPTKNDELVGICQAGKKTIPGFEGHRFKFIQSRYTQKAMQSRDAIFLQGRVEGGGFLEKEFPESFSPPVGEWVLLPLWIEDEFRGDLVLDNITVNRGLREVERQQLNLFARLVSPILARARLFSKEQHSRKEIEIISNIGKHVTTRAALDDLPTLLEHIRQQIGQLVDVTNFIIALVDEETNRLAFELHYEDGQATAKHDLPSGEGMTAHLIQRQRELYLERGDEKYVIDNGIEKHGRPSKCWVGLPLQVGKKTIGAMVLQNYERIYAYTSRDVELLRAVADRVAGAIQVSRLAQQERENARQLGILARASAKFIDLANYGEDSLWFALLTLTTADYGFQFNRAWLFLTTSSKTQLVGKIGIGHLELEKAQRDWEKDEIEELDFDKMISKLKAKRLRHTPLERATRGLVIDIDDGQNSFAQVLRSGQRQIISLQEIHTLLPSAFIQKFSVDTCAVLPLRTGDDTIGVVIVDDAFNHRPIRPTALDRLETLLNIAGQAWQNMKQGQKLQAIQDATYAIMGSASNRPLSQTLTSICQSVLTIGEADCALIYPLKPDSVPPEYETENVGYVGQLFDIETSDKPRQRGVSAHILRAGKLVVPDILDFHSVERYHGARLADHPFLKREKIRAFIGTVARDATTGEALGLLYLDYRSIRHFTPQDINRADAFANLAAIAIKNARQSRAVQQELVSARSHEKAGAEELFTLQRVLEEALVTENEESLIKTFLYAIRSLLPDVDVQTALMLREWVADTDDSEPYEIQMLWMLNELEMAVNMTPAVYSETIAKQVLEEGRSYVTDSQRQVYVPFNVPVKSGKKTIGVLFVNSLENTISDTSRTSLERLASAASLAFENIRRLNNLKGILLAAEALTAPIELKDTLRAIRKAVREIAPDVSAFTIWHRSPENSEIRLGTYFGVRNLLELESDEVCEGGLVDTILHTTEPVWAPDVSRSNLAKKFVASEGIISSAAFPLQADNDPIGVIFINYRSPHTFQEEEKSLFTILVQVVAASIRDAIYLEARKKESERLDATIEVTRAIGASLDLDQIIRKALSKLQDLLRDSKTVPCLLMFNEEEKVLEFAPASWEFYQIDNPDYLNRRFLRLGEDPSVSCIVAQQTIEEKQPITFNLTNVISDTGYLNLISSTKSELCTSLVTDEQLLGVLVLESPHRAAFGEAEIRLVKGIAQQISLAISQAKQSAQLSFKSTVAAKTAWAAEIAHDINREIGRIRELTYWIREENKASEQTVTYTRQIDESAGRLIDAGSLENPGAEDILLDQEIQRLANQMIRNAKQPVEAVYDLNCPALSLRVNRLALERVLRSLIRNAFESMQAQTDRLLTIKTAHSPEKNRVEIIIQDSGPGIDASIRPVLLQRPVTTKGGRGGFGLLLARQVVEDMGGQIRLLPSDPIQGAAFLVTLPLNVTQ